MKNIIGSALIIVGFVVMVGVVGGADYAVETRTAYSDIKLFFGVLGGGFISYLGIYIRGGR